MEPNSFEIFKPEYRNTNCNPSVLKNRFEFCLKALESSEKECDELKNKILELEKEIKTIKSKKNKKEISKEEIEPEIIFHLAGYVNPERDIKVIHENFSTNLIGIQNLLFHLMDYDYDLFINTGTSDGYGREKAPFKEDIREMIFHKRRNGKPLKINVHTIKDLEI